MYSALVGARRDFGRVARAVLRESAVLGADGADDFGPVGIDVFDYMSEGRQETGGHQEEDMDGPVG